MRTVFALLAACLFAATALAAEPIRPLDRKSAKQLTDPTQHKQPTIVALWSTDCPHCKKNLALFARLTKEDRRLRLLTVATEPVWDGLAAPLRQLGGQGEHYAYGDDAPEALAYALDTGWRGELPRTLFFDGRGGRQSVSGIVDANRVRTLLFGDTPRSEPAN